jgi:hypothetical protein
LTLGRSVHANIQGLSVSVLLSTRATKRKIPRRGTGGFLFAKAQKNSLTILWALLTALLSTLLATTALLTALASGRLSLLTRFLRFLLTTLLAALLAALLLPTHFFVSHGAIGMTNAMGRNAGARMRRPC